MGPEFRVEYRRLEDPRWFFGEAGTEKLCRDRGNELWEDPTTYEVRIIEWTPRVVAQKKR